jgi:hypothetical protein
MNSILRAVGTLLVASLLAACGPAAPTATRGPAAPTAPPSVAPATTAPAATLTATAGPAATASRAASATRSATAPAVSETLFQLQANNPIVRHGAAWDRTYLDPGAIVYHQGQFHMFYNGIAGFPSPVGVGYATSPDGLTWTRQGSTPVLQFAPTGPAGGYDGPNLFVTSALVQDDGSWVLYYYNMQGGNFVGPQSIGRATAPAPAGPWTPDANPVLAPGPAGAWDATQVTAPNVLRVAQGYIMYYEGAGQNSPSMIGRATSPDGVHWTKYDDPATTEPLYAASDPVLRPGPAGAWDSRRVLDPNVIQTANGWAMVYLSTGATGGKFSSGPYEFGYATSPDGLAWTRAAANPFLSSRNHPTWQGIYLVTLVQQGGTQYLYFDIGTGGGTDINAATHSGELP